MENTWVNQDGRQLELTCTVRYGKKFTFCGLLTLANNKKMPPKKIFEGWPLHSAGSNDEPTESVLTVPGIDSVPTRFSSLSNVAVVSDNEGP